MYQQLEQRLRQARQQHLLRFWNELDEPARQRLARQISSVDLDLMAQLFAQQQIAVDWAELSRRAEPPPAIRRTGQEQQELRHRARQRGAEALKQGEVGIILVAGGQGTRLGFPHPKGMFPLGVISHRCLFQILIDHLRAVERRYGRELPLYLMTSPATHDETVTFFAEHAQFGLADDQLQIFCQGTMPAVDARTGKLLLEDRDRLALSPDGHGGMLSALHQSGALADAQGRGIKHLFYAQIDNPLVQIADSELIGHHVLAGSEMTTQVVPKRFPLERVGNLVAVDGHVQIIEYSDLPEDAAQRRNPDGSLQLWAGNIAVHVFEVAFLQRSADRADVLPFHRAIKKVQYLSQDGEKVEPEEPNAIKFERFIFDLLPSARQAIVVEADPAEAFAPVKNASGAETDTPETAQQAMVRLHQQWLRAAGVQVADEVPVEINPLWALGAPEVATKLAPGTVISEPTYFA